MSKEIVIDDTVSLEKMGDYVSKRQCRKGNRATVFPVGDFLQHRSGQNNSDCTFSFSSSVFYVTVWPV